MFWETIILECSLHRNLMWQRLKFHSVCNSCHLLILISRFVRGRHVAIIFTCTPITYWKIFWTDKIRFFRNFVAIIWNESKLNTYSLKTNENWKFYQWFMKVVIHTKPKLISSIISEGISNSRIFIKKKFFSKEELQRTMNYQREV